MCRLAPDHTAQGDVAIKVAHPLGNADGRGHLQRTGDLDQVMGPADSLDLGLGAFDEHIGDIPVIGSDNDQQLDRLVEAWARQDVMGFGSGHHPISEILRVPVISSP